MSHPSVLPQTHWQALRLYISSTHFLTRVLKMRTTVRARGFDKATWDVSLATHSWEMKLIHMRLLVLSTWPTAFASQPLLGDPHARTPTSIAHCIVLHLPERNHCLLSSAHSASRRALCCDIGTMVLVSVHTSTLV